MKILVTGARGNFATALIPRLLLAPHTLVLLDMEPMTAPDRCVSIQADIRDSGAVTYAMAGCEAVIHAADVQQAHADFRNYDDFYSANVTGTHNVLRAMLMHGARNIVISSTDAVYGAGLRGHRVVQESLACIPNHYYSETKLLCEEMARFYARRHGYKVAILRYGDFTPVDWRAAGVARLSNGVDREDVAMANELALGAVAAEEFSCEIFQIYASKPFTADDWPALEVNPAHVVETYYPGATDLLAEHGLSVPHIHHKYDITRATTILGYDPQHNFPQFLARLRMS